MDICVTLPKSFGLEKWMAEGDAPGDAWTGQYYAFTVAGAPKVEPGDRVYVAYDGRLIGYAPLVQALVRPSLRNPRRSATELIRGGEAVACTVNEHIPGFRGYRYRWWDREDELPAKATCTTPDCDEKFDLGYEFPGLCGGGQVPDHGCGEPFCERHLFTADEHRDLTLCKDCCEDYVEHLSEPAGM